ncbi:helix-turn-helix domain-containing protein [Melghirimyces algeriensis]
MVWRGEHMYKVFQFRLYPTKEQTTLISKSIGYEKPALLRLIQ